jgi:putative SbcD/Mre11-related phosphoesterase
MQLEPVHNEPALLYADEGAIIVADLHIGIEYELFTAGTRIPGRTNQMLRKMVEILKSAHARKLVLLGDLKHNVPQVSFTESREIPPMMDALFEFADEIHLTPGNHDGGIHNYLPSEVKVHSSKGFVLGELGLWHGHTWPSEEVMACGTVATAHVHPSVLFVDGVGARHRERCWLRGKWAKKKVKERYEKAGKGFVMLPAFNELCGGGQINSKDGRKVGTVLRHGLADFSRTEIYLLDGTNLGTVSKNLVTLTDRNRCSSRWR